MRTYVALAIAAAIVSTPVLAQEGLPSVIPPAAEWVDVPTLAPTVTDRETRVLMNQEIVRAIAQANGDQAAARAAISAIVARYQQAASAQGARIRPGPK